jgi:phosphoglycolate phosphatase-like HAD superfamily hydrolase
MSIRNALTLKYARPVIGIVTTLDTLSDNYVISILSATDESVIRRLLIKHRVTSIGLVSGRRSTPNRKSGQSKVDRGHRLLNIIGLNPSDAVLVGDGNEDYAVAKKIGTAFIEVTYHAKRYGRESLISAIAARKWAVISGEDRSELASAVRSLVRNF